ncbi:MAG: YwaF family protein, partial [Clostridia bacterium]|nr:YwaF family protein [Clostridia bacterium]
MNALREFFGYDGYARDAEGYMSWQHLTFVTALTLIMILAAVLLGRRNKIKDDKARNRVLIITAILIDAFELFKIVYLCFRHHDPLHWLNNLPLFLCSIQLITIPLAAFSKGRTKEAALDFVTIFGVLGAILGTYAAGNNYAAYPVISFDNVVSGITHCLAGFASLYIIISGMASMKRKNIIFTACILTFFCIAAYVANIFTDANYMFLLRGDGTPYDILFNIFNGNKVLYPLSVVALFVIYIIIFYYVFYACTKKSKK